MTDRSRYQEYRDRLRGGPARVPEPCGTMAAVRRHERNGEALDDACREERNRNARELYRKRKGR